MKLEDFFEGQTSSLKCPRLTFEELKDMIAGSVNLSVTWRRRDAIQKSVDFPVVSSRRGSELGVSINIYIPIYMYINTYRFHWGDQVELQSEFPKLRNHEDFHPQLRRRKVRKC